MQAIQKKNQSISKLT